MAIVTDYPEPGRVKIVAGDRVGYIKEEHIPRVVAGDFSCTEGKWELAKPEGPPNEEIPEGFSEKEEVMNGEEIPDTE